MILWIGNEVYEDFPRPVCIIVKDVAHSHITSLRSGAYRRYFNGSSTPLRSHPMRRGRFWITHSTIWLRDDTVSSVRGFLTPDLKPSTSSRNVGLQTMPWRWQNFSEGIRTMPRLQNSWMSRQPRSLE